MAVCAACGAENGDRARFCQGCGTPLGAKPSAPRHEPQAPTQAAGLLQTCPACQSKNPLAATACRTCRASLLPALATPSRKAAPVARGPNAGRLVLVGLVLASAAAGGWWFGTNREKAAPATPRVAVVAPDAGPSTP
ncbi:double zinc ribbon domain-containing protein [Hydrogenophaga taeniospiralis]|uniref:double zinc ribbon domain-containing protein n=1 Tax=Hydrogenophaga taeniospiralis TaxID=65656 RepID=UPI001CFBADC5